MKLAPDIVTVAERVASAEAVLVDMDGCLIASGRALPGAERLIEMAGERLYLVSNNSSHSAGELAAWLAMLGLSIPAERMVLAGELALHTARQHFPHQPLMLLARTELQHYAATLGTTLDDENPACVVLTRDLDLTYARLAQAIKHLSRGVPLLVANPDLTHPDWQGEPVPETGSLLAMFRAAVPQLDHQVLGKPQPALFEAALVRAGARAEFSLMIGDNPVTDGAGAESLGIPFFQVGHARDADAADIARLLAMTLG
ncbi:HAD-IIA family hydrolase [Zobellella maritima]|uniref:HAD-IIA family hydrolase n=1 Tax=Zobellella maritima TaxID=2059725 RepID=UPI0018E4DD21|nr:HAD family hydrolase [Zobellella maritima]